MPIGDWVDLPVLKIISRHTVGAVAALMSYFIVSRLLEWLVGPGMMRDLVEYSDQFILGAIFLYFILTVGYDLYREFKKNAGTSSFVLV